jgi:hypothetical protein
MFVPMMLLVWDDHVQVRSIDKCSEIHTNYY